MKVSFLCSVALLLGAVGCGDKKTASVPGPDAKKGADGTQETVESAPNMLTADPRTMKYDQLYSLVDSLYSRDLSERRELKILQEMNKSLCQRLQTLKTDCIASARLIHNSGDNQVLGCDGSMQGNTSIAPTLKVKVDGEISEDLRLSANNEYATDYFTSETTDSLKFSPMADASRRSPRYLDLSTFKLEAKDGDMPNMYSFTFEVTLNEKVLVNQDDFVAPIKEGDKSHIRVDPNRILELQKSSDCQVSPGEIQQIKKAVMAEYDQTPAISAPSSSDNSQSTGGDK